MPVDRVIPPALLTPAVVHRIVLHWTAGSYRPNGLDLRHYHLILEDLHAQGRGDDVKVHRGVYSPQDNERTGDGRYAAHTSKLNSHSFGLCVSCMGGARQGGPFGKWPLTKMLWERMAQAAAELAEFYELDITERTILQHGEVEDVYPQAPQRGKWDVTQLPWAPERSQREVCAEFRRRVHWYAREYLGRG